MENYSVLMSVYCKEKAEYLDIAMQSMFDQTIPTNDFVLVCDGPLTDELEAVICKMKSQHSEVINIVRLPNNIGLGNALNIGLKHCRNDLVARMDSDDISLPGRCECQLEMFSRNSELALCSGDIAEFDSDPSENNDIRHVPETYEEILQFAKRRSPMNHMAVMYRKSAVENAGGYIEISLAEDYYLWARMLKKGYYAENAGRVLVKARTGNGMYARRGGWKYAKNSCYLQRQLLRIKFISPIEYSSNCLIRMIGSLMPVCVRKKIYQKTLRQ